MSHPVTKSLTNSNISIRQSQEKTSQDVKILQATIRDLKNTLKKETYEAISAERVRREIFQISNIEPKIPQWVIEPQKKSGNGPGVPSLFLSDWHWGEWVDPQQVDGVNVFNLTIAHQRTKILIEHTIDLLSNHIVNPEYPGIVVPLGGDFFSGNIKDELKETNEKPIMPVIIDLFSTLTYTLTIIADHFHKVFLPCVTGNHGRTSHKPQYKDRVYTNYDWLLYQLLEKHFEKDRRFTFFIGNGSDVYFKIFNHKYLLTHGDQFRGGDGVAGAVSPITRGDYKKRSRNMEINAPYDTMILGHWHQLMQLRRFIVNGSLVGYNEYAMGNNFPYEPAQQALWLTHPRWHITFSLPVIVDRIPKKKIPSWISIAK